MKKEAHEGLAFQASQKSESSPTQLSVSSRIPGFAKMSPRARVQALIERGLLSQEDISVLLGGSGLTSELADHFIENCVGTYSLPIGIATNFLIDGEEVFIPMAVEESSVVAAASHGAKFARSCGGFFSEPTRCIATCQVQFEVPAGYDVTSVFFKIREQLIAIAERCHPRLISRGGSIHDLELRSLPKEGMYVIHVHVDTLEAMGANIVNTIAEEIGRSLPQFIPCTVGLRILTNLTIHRVTKVRCEIDISALEMEGFSGQEAAQRLCAAWEFADLDPFRAATHNKGIMNGIDPVVLATGNDWRAVEAGCHAYATLKGSYKPLTHWFMNAEGRLQGEIELPIAVGTVGGVTKLHPTARSSLKILGNPSAERLSAIIACVGLAQNLAALRALACEGIQRGHMDLHKKNIEMMRRYDHVPAIAAVPVEAKHHSGGESAALSQNQELQS
jgi:hydroxymethylglutaryl-CoA reductase